MNTERATTIAENIDEISNRRGARFMPVRGVKKNAQMHSLMYTRQRPKSHPEKSSLVECKAFYGHVRLSNQREEGTLTWLDLYL